MVDPGQPGEDFDDELLDGEFPPEEPLAAEDDGVTGIEQPAGESFAERDERIEPEPWEPSRRGGGRERGRDELSGDETTRDVAPERDPQPAEEAAVEVDEEAGPRER